ncbi:MAG: pantoate--beta-alanine ligase [Candidatus Omnitrophica bacterium CG1_02_49_10]|nr:MAG: pantoate--beta-alanine ligase [Candidatus Omnitrophica bacterium CG1_02_49_10]
MIVFRSIGKTRDYLEEARRKRRSVGFVPTMGYLHEGHLSLIRKARRDNDVVVVSIFVNPTQFGPNEDLSRYPRDLKRDKRLLRAEGVDLLFYPSVRSLYPDGFKAYIEVKGLSGVMCGSSRPAHFRGVCTVVAKLFNIIMPDIAYFGRKDAQQAVIVKKMASDLNMNVSIEALPIVREKDGLAMSSRNSYLSKTERRDAPIIFRSLREAERAVKAGVRDAGKIKSLVKSFLRASKSMKIDYVNVVDEVTLEEVKRVTKPALLAVAVRMGRTRLIDNIVLK